MFVRHLLHHVMALLVGVVLVPAPPAQTEGETERPTWGALDATGSGFLLGRTEFGAMSLSGYAVICYINQLPATQSFVDHPGNTNGPQSSLFGFYVGGHKGTIVSSAVSFLF